MEEVLLRFLIVWASLHIILFFVEWYRYKHCGWSWRDFKRLGMLDTTYAVLCIDTLCCVGVIVCGLVCWILEPIIH